jgi:DNA-binding GntR family transcriptional regulator
VARSASDVELAELATLNSELGTVVHNPTQSSEINRQFHAALMHAARNRFLLAAGMGMDKTMLILGRTTLEPHRAPDAHEEHARILAGLESRDGDAAEAAMRAHIEAALRARLRAMRLAEREADAAENPDDD